MIEQFTLRTPSKCHVTILGFGRPLFFQQASKGDLPGALGSISHCANVFERFHGLCRFVSM